jgi:hypothetical protein
MVFWWYDFHSLSNSLSLFPAPSPLLHRCRRVELYHRSSELMTGKFLGKMKPVFIGTNIFLYLFLVIVIIVFAVTKENKEEVN